jgi:hypothetical protein
VSKALIINDIDKFSQSLNMIYKNQLNLSNQCKKQYSELFKKIKPIDDNKIMMGYFCKSELDHEKETSKAISKFLVKKSIDLFKEINGATFNLLQIAEQLDSNINYKNDKIIEAFEKNKPYIYTVDFHI